MPPTAADNPWLRMRKKVVQAYGEGFFNSRTSHVYDVFKDEASKMVAYLKKLQLMVQKIPEQLELVDELPRNPAGKVQKNLLRERYASQ